MFHIFKQLVATIRRSLRWGRGDPRDRLLNLGFRVHDEEPTRSRVLLSARERAMHVAVVGKSGTGKSSLLKYMSAQDIEADRGFAYFDLHGDAALFLLRSIAARERILRRHLSDRVILIAPGDPEISVGINPLEQESPDFARIGEFAEVLRHRWHLSHFGARTDELLRNSLYVLSANGFTLVELAALLTHSGFRSACLKKVANAEVRQYFESRYDQAGDTMRAAMREPILNKTSAFTADPHFRHIVGQEHSTFSMKEAMDQGHWIIIDLQKGKLGEQALTLGSLIFTMLKNALFTREKRSLYTIYCDEIQNLVPYTHGGIETVLSEARKFGVGIVTANQFLDQHPPEVRAAILAVDTHIFFQLSSADANVATQSLDGGASLAYRLKNLPNRHAIVKSGSERWVEAEVPRVDVPKVDYTDLFNRSRFARGRVRAHIDRDIAKRDELAKAKTDDVLHAWE